MSAVGLCRRLTLSQRASLIARAIVDNDLAYAINLLKVPAKQRGSLAHELARVELTGAIDNFRTAAALYLGVSGLRLCNDCGRDTDAVSEGTAPPRESKATRKADGLPTQAELSAMSDDEISARLAAIELEQSTHP